MNEQATSPSPPYELLETLRRDERKALYRAVRGSDGRRVLLKVLDPRCCREKDLEQLRNELSTAASLDPRTVVRPLALDTYQGMPALALEDAGGHSLDLLLGGPMPTGRFLVLAARIADAVAEVHRQGVVHKDLKPANLVVDPATSDVRIIDFGLASRLPREEQPYGAPELIEGSLPYMSPEQTGRLNRAVDSRTDLYSLGVTFYEMLAGRRPFEARDPLEWVHCHVARAPTPLSQLVPDLPEVVSRIVMRLLAKMADDRYHTAVGLRHDLERCLAGWAVERRVEPFPLGERDAPGRFRVPQRLYGREAEAAELLRAFERVVAAGTPELLLISGYSGVGKSSLVHELRRAIVRERGLFLSGKFDELARGTPYSTVARAFSELVLEILAQPEERMGAWRRQIQGALGSNGKLLADLIPVLAQLLGEQPPVPELPAAEAEQRFRRVFRDFLGVFATPERPVVLFLDDLHWADAATLRLLEYVVADPGTRHLLLVGAYRDNEVSPSHPLAQALERMRKAAAVVRELALRPLGTEQIVDLVADSTHFDRERARPLAALVHEKTGGNPFFAIQFLMTLHREKLLERDPSTQAWRCDLARIHEKGYTENVVDLMARNLVRLPESCKDALGIAACIGNVGEISLLALAHGKPEEETLADLWEAMSEGYLVRRRWSYAFAHDRFQQAAQALVPEDRRAAVHLRVGRLLLEKTPPDRLDERIFDVVAQLDLGAGLIAERADRTRVAELNLRAARKAKAAVAYRAAIAYLSAAVELLGSDPWAERELAFEVTLEIARCQFLSGAHDEAERGLPELHARARTRLEKAAVHLVQIDVQSIKSEGDEAIESALRCLRMLGIDMVAHPSAEEVQQAYEEVWKSLGDRPIEDLIHLPPMADPEMLAAMDVLSRLYAPAYYSDNNLFCLHLCHAVNISLRHGNSPAATYAYGWFGVILISVFHRATEGYRFAKLGYDLVESRQLLAYKAKATMHMKVAAFWTRPIDEAVAFARASSEAGVGAGDLVAACFGRSETVLGMLVRGDPLAEVELEAERGLDFARKAGFAVIRDLITGFECFARAMRGSTRHLSTCDDEGFSEAELEARLDARRQPSLVFFHFTLKLMARFLSGDLEAALAAADRCRPLLWAGLFSVQSHWFHLYDALAQAAVFHRLPANRQEEALAILAGHLAQLRECAAVNPRTFHAAYAMASAELARIEGRELEAERFYEEAVRSARESHLVQNEALASELASAFHRTCGLDSLADSYLRDARACCLRWGASGKVAQIDRLRQHLVRTPASRPTATFAISTERLDLLAVIKASQAISGHVEMERLAATILQVVLEQGGARRGYLVLARDGALSIEAEATLEGRGVTSRALPSLDVETSALMPMSVIQRARRTRQPVILDDASAGAGAVVSDPFFGRSRARSVLCLPIVRQDVVALLYLENDLVAGTFTPDRLAALSLLASQAAISLENARLYREAQEGIRVREEFLSVASHELRTPIAGLMLSVESLVAARQAGRADDPAVMGGLLDLLARHGRRLARLVNDLLDVSRLQKRPSLELEEVELGALVREVVSRLAPELALAGCEVSIQAGAPVLGHWDRSRLEQLATNLLANAMKFGTGRPVEISVAAQGDRAKLLIRDHGIGISPGFQPRLFRRFERGVSADHYAGLGLGLYISRQIVEAHRGSIAVESQPGAGATFIVDLPRAGSDLARSG